MRRSVILIGLLALALAPAADAGLERYATDGGDALSLKRGAGTALLVNTDGAALGTVRRGRVRITAPARRRDVWGCERIRRPDLRTIVCIGRSLNFSVLGGAWRVRVAGAEINASAVMNGYVTLDNGTAGTYAIRDRAPRPWPATPKTFYLG